MSLQPREREDGRMERRKVGFLDRNRNLLVLS